MEVIENLENELQAAHKANAIPYFHIYKISTTHPITPYDEPEFYYHQVDLYIALSISYMDREHELKTYLRQKYGNVIRVLVVETY